MKQYTKQLICFGNEEVVIIGKKKEKPDLFNDYDGFCKKFEVKNNRRLLYTKGLWI